MDTGQLGKIYRALGSYAHQEVQCNAMIDAFSQGNCTLTEVDPILWTAGQRG